MESLINSFEIYLLKEKRYSVHTVTAYINDVRQFFCFNNAPTQNGNQILPQVFDQQLLTKSSLKAWIYSISNQGIEPKSINRKISSIKRFSKWLLKNGTQINESIFEVMSLKTSKQLPLFLSDAQSESLVHTKTLQTNAPINFEDLQNHLMVLILLSTGIRRAELRDLKDSSFDFEKKLLKVRGKGNKDRLIPILERLEEEIKIFLKLKKEKFPIQLTDNLLVNKKGLAISENIIYSNVKKLLYLETGNRQLSTHKLRHTFATGLLNNGAELEAIKALLGHKSLSSTQVYTHNAIEKLKEVYKLAHPEANQKD